MNEWMNELTNEWYLTGQRLGSENSPPECCRGVELEVKKQNLLFEILLQAESGRSWTLDYWTVNYFKSIQIWCILYFIILLIVNFKHYI